MMNSGLFIFMFMVCFFLHLSGNVLKSPGDLSPGLQNVLVKLI